MQGNYQSFSMKYHNYVAIPTCVKYGYIYIKASTLEWLM